MDVSTSSDDEPPAASRDQRAVSRPLAGLCRPLRVDERHRRRAVGHLVAPDDRARHVLDAGAPGDLSRWRRRRPDVRLAGAARDVCAAREAERAQTVRFWGFSAPFGAWVCIWGAFAMLTSAPFDDWWHNTYGLDVKILSPPHVVLAAGIGAIQVGAMLMVVACQNRSARPVALAAAAVRLQRRADAAQHRDADHRIHAALGHAPVALLSGRVRHVSVLARGRRARLGHALAGDDGGGGLRGDHDADAVDSAALSRPPAARPDLRADDALPAAGSAAAARRAGDRHRHRDAAVGTGTRLAVVGDPRVCVSCGVSSPCSGHLPTSS